jgi:TonB family protein
MFEPEDAKPASPAPGSEDNGGISPGAEVGKFDLSELTAAFNAHGGARVTPELSADLALDIVLNEIVEQACLATGASGAAIVLERDGEWICRACAGDNSPRLGARLDAQTGLSGACMKSRELQRCDDSQSDPRVDIEACRELGVRSVMILPLLQNGGLAGLFELFSGTRSAFGDRDERTLEALAQRVLSTLRKTAEPVAALPVTTVPDTTSWEPSVAAIPEAEAEATYEEKALPEPELGPDLEARLFGAVLPNGRRGTAGRGTQFLTWILGAAVLACAVFLTVVVAQRVAGGKTAIHASSPSERPRVSARRESGAAAANATPSASISGSTSSGSAEVSVPGSPASPVSGPSQSSAPPGSLLVYENGKEIFRMPPAAEAAVNDAITSAKDAANRGGEQPASAVERVANAEPSASTEVNVLYRVEPDYPEAARVQQIQGAVVLEVLTAHDGAVQEVKLVSGEPLLAEAAIAAVRQWRFKPRVVQGQPIETQTRVVLNFRLPR